MAVNWQISQGHMYIQATMPVVTKCSGHQVSVQQLLYSLSLLSCTTGAVSMFNLTVILFLKFCSNVIHMTFEYAINWFFKSNSNHCALVATGHAWLSIVELNCAACVSSEKRTLHYVLLWVKILILSVEWALSFSIELAGATSPRSWNWKEKQSYTSQVIYNTDCMYTAAI